MIKNFLKKVLIIPKMLIFLILIFQIIENSTTVRVSSYCGHPGLPPEGTLYQVNSGRIRFHDGEVVRYRCSPEFHTFTQTRKCVSGSWVGERARCGVPIENDIQSVQVFNCSDSENSITNKEIFSLDINQTENPLRFANSFHASRVKTGPITVYGSACYLWKFKLKMPSMVPFLTIDFATQLSQRDSSGGSIDDINSTSLRTDILTVEPYVSPYRMCRYLNKLDFINGDPYSNTTFLLRGFYFRCDSITANEYYLESIRLSNTIMVQTRTNYPRDVNLVALFLATHKIDPKTDKPDCGKPETVRTGANFREASLDKSQFQFQCNDSFVDVTPNKPIKAINSKSNYWYPMNCSINGLWEGQFPLCIPRIQCPGLQYLEANKDMSVIIESVENVYYVNETYWVAGEHSQVNFACINEEHIVVGRLTRTCLKDGLWSHNMPKCTAYVKPESLNTVAQSPWTIIAILAALLFLFLTFVFLIIRKYVSNMRKELLRYRNKPRTQPSVYTDSINYIYDDCRNTRFSTRNLSNKVNRMTKKNFHKYKYDGEYIELEGTPPTTSTSQPLVPPEPLYIPILPPIQ